jgi:hypothetical protein
MGAPSVSLYQGVCMVRVLALAKFDYQGRAVKAHDLVLMLPIDAAVHGRLGHVSLDAHAADRYAHRMMTAQAEPPAPVVVVPPQESTVPSATRASTRRRRSSRRNAA